MTNCSNRRRGTWANQRSPGERGPQHLSLPAPLRIPQGIPLRGSEALAAQKDLWVGHYLASREADPSRGWESHGASWVWGPRKTETDRPQGSPPLLCWGTQAQMTSEGQCLRLQGRLLVQNQTPSQRPWRPVSQKLPPSYRGEEAPYPSGEVVGTKDATPAGAVPFLEAEFPCHTLS